MEPEVFYNKRIADLEEQRKVLIDFVSLLVELQGVEPWSKHIRHKLSTCLLLH